LSRSRILVVDDDAGLRRTLERILSPAYHVETVAGASEALERVEAARYDLALARLKRATLQLCSAIRERRPQTVILITGSISERTRSSSARWREGAFASFKPLTGGY
jgi:CheY-like chemotaxis protein